MLGIAVGCVSMRKQGVGGSVMSVDLSQKGGSVDQYSWWGVSADLFQQEVSWWIHTSKLGGMRIYP